MDRRGKLDARPLSPRRSSGRQGGPRLDGYDHERHDDARGVGCVSIGPCGLLGPEETIGLHARRPIPTRSFDRFRGLSSEPLPCLDIPGSRGDRASVGLTGCLSRRRPGHLDGVAVHPENELGGGSGGAGHGRTEVWCPARPRLIRCDGVATSIAGGPMDQIIDPVVHMGFSINPFS